MVAAFPYFEAVVSFLVIEFILEHYIDWRQHLQSFREDVPKVLQERISRDDMKKTNAYSKDKYWFGVVESLFGFVLMMAVLFSGFLPWLWNVSASMLSGFTQHEIPISLLFSLLYSLIFQIPDLPFDVYRTFVLEEKHGFNKQTWRVFVTDILKKNVLTVVIGGPILSAVLFILSLGYLSILFGFFLVIQFVIMMVYFDWIAPCFNKFVPLEQGELRTKIEDLCRSVNYSLNAVFVMDGATRSSHSNAFFFGFWKKKRLVLYDTILEKDGVKNNIDDIMGVVAHELSHWMCNHTWKLMVIQFAVLSIYFQGFSFLIHSRDMYTAFGFSTQPILIGLIIFSKIFGPVEHVVDLVVHAISRKFEYEADEGAHKLGYDIGKALISIYSQNRGAIHVDPWYSLMHNSHPTLLERIAAVKQLEQKKK